MLVSGSVFGALAEPTPTVTVPLDVTWAPLPPPIVIGYSPSRQVDVTRIRPLVWFTHTSVPLEDASWVAAYATPAPSASTTTAEEMILAIIASPFRPPQSLRQRPARRR